MHLAAARRDGDVVYVEAGLTVEIEDSGGDVVITDTSGEVKVSHVKGTVQLP